MKKAFSKGLTPALIGGIACGLISMASTFRCAAAMDPNYIGHDRTRPQPPVIDPGVASTQDQAGKAPSDAVVLFDGTDVSKWASMDGTPTKWIARDGYMECVKGSGYIRTLQNFGDCQLHVEWAAPTPGEGSGQGRGNSGVFLGFDRYEIQVLDCYKNTTYADGSAGAVYNQYPPLVNACRPPGQWQAYDIIYTAPRFDADGKLLSPARITALHNGVLIQNNVELAGSTGWLNRGPYSVHSEKQPICFQDHGNPVRFRNVWVRELGNPGKKEFTLPTAVLQSYTGSYAVDSNMKADVTLENGQIQLKFAGTKFTMFAESDTKFFAKTVDVQCEFFKNDQGQVEKVVFSVGEGGMSAKRVK
jgi:hypothetical protein